MYEPLHHKYRPQTFAQLVGQGAIAETLTHALRQNRIAPAYLFCGPRGTGKTSSARILAKSLNCLRVGAPTPEPCGECDVCQSVTRGNALDIVEIDAASNTGIDNIRELIERAQFAPVQCRYKVYVIDECHMLSTAAFNALLKTLEEPPDRVVFVLATTDPQRVLPTIISRCQRFDFRRIPLNPMVKHLSYISTEEAINIADPAIQLVAQISQGGLRDAESLLDQLSLQADEITVETVWDLVGAVPERDLLNLVRAIAADDSTALLDRVRHLMDKGREPLIVLQSLVGFYRDLLIAKNAPTRADLVAITPPTWAEMATFAKGLSTAQLLAGQQKLQTSEVQVKNTTQPRLWLEITLSGLLPSALGAVANLAASTADNTHKASARSVLSVTASSPIPSPIQSLPTSSPPIPTPTSSSPTNADAPSPPTEPGQTSPAPSSAESPPEQPDQETPKNVPPTVPAEPSDPQIIQPPAPEPTAEAAFGSLDDLWAKILLALKPRGTQMLMNQQGTLLFFDGVSANVGFRSASLQKMAQQRVPNLEDAFEAVFQRPIRVSLKVAAAPPMTAKRPPNSSPTPSPKSTPPHPPTPNPNHSNSNGQPSNGSQVNGQPPNSSQSDSSQSDSPQSDSSQSDSLQTNGSAPSAQSPQNTALQPSANSSPPSLPLSPQDNLPSAPNPSGPSPSEWQSNQEQDNIKRFAQFFNGQIVNLDDDESLGGGSGPTSSEPGPDVPF